jgi:hypothetical protein
MNKEELGEKLWDLLIEFDAIEADDLKGSEGWHDFHRSEEEDDRARTLMILKRFKELVEKE